MIKTYIQCKHSFRKPSSLRKVAMPLIVVLVINSPWFPNMKNIYFEVNAVSLW